MKEFLPERHENTGLLLTLLTGRPIINSRYTSGIMDCVSRRKYAPNSPEPKELTLPDGLSSDRLIKSLTPSRHSVETNRFLRRPISDPRNFLRNGRAAVPKGLTRTFSFPVSIPAATNHVRLIC